MRARIVKIGNSQGIRIPKPLLEQLKIKEDVDIEIENNQITIRPVSK
jgi:antitoxin MazE